MLMLCMLMATMAAAMTVTSFAAAEAFVTAEMLEPVLEGVKANLGVIIPVGIGLFAIIFGIGFIPKLFNMFGKK
jgi:hypothetical protein